jgi:hypothetical protein
MSPGRVGYLGFVVVLALLGTCKPDPVVGTFFCNASSNEPMCGTTASGQPYVCFGGKQLGAGEDFCTEPCSSDPAAPPATDSICLNGAKLKTCKPSETSPEDPDGCGDRLACLRTDLARDEGVCLAMKVCSDDQQCTGVVSTCGATVLKAMFPKAPYNTTNLQCVVTGCKAKQANCQLGETCLPVAVLAQTPVPDICVPTCDSGSNCPPNYFCWRKESGQVSKDVCLPTLPGARCTTSLDCWAGDCVDSGEGFKLCALPCERDQDCVAVSSSSQRQYCAPKDGKKYCMAISPFNGTLCFVDDNCKMGQRCYHTSPYWPNLTELGECRLPCDEGDRCPVRGGLPHSCFVRGTDRSCYVGVLGVTCQHSDDCLAGRTCEGLPPEDGSSAPPVRVCTQPCTSDPDCLDAWGNQEGYCTAGWCRLGRQIGTACMRDQQCAANVCVGGICTRR